MRIRSARRGRRSQRRKQCLNRCQQRMSDFLLNCFVLGDDERRVFPVKIPRNDNVGILKDKIKKRKAPHLDHIDASDLDLWKVSFPIDDHASKTPQTEPPLRVNKRLSSLWDGEPSDDDLHILVKAPGTPTTNPYFSKLITFKSVRGSWPRRTPLTQLLRSR